MKYPKCEVLLTAIFGLLTSSVYAGEVKVMSYNVLAGFDQQRGDRLIAVIRDQSPALLGLQEVVGDNIDYLYEQLSDDYSVLFADTLDPVLVARGSGLRIIEQGTKELFRCTVDRQVNWVRVEDIESGREFIYYNTHLCFILQNILEGVTNEEANQIQAGQIIELMAEQAEDRLIQIIGGDLNTFASSNTTRFFIAGQPLPYNGQHNPLALKDTWPAAPGNTGEKPSTRGGRIPGQGRAGSGPRPAGAEARPRLEMPDEPGIDWIFVSDWAEVTSAEVIRDDLSIGASDHMPITATIAL